MTTILPDFARSPSPGQPALANDNYLTHSRGFLSWALTLDHKRIGLLYLCSVLLAFFVGGMMAEVVRTQLLTPNGLLFHYSVNGAAAPDDAGAHPAYKLYDQAFTLHGAIMIFLVL